MHLLRPSSLIFGGLLIAATASPAAAYIRTKTCDPAGLNGPYCAPEQLPVAVRWRDPCVTYLVNARGSDEVRGVGWFIDPDELADPDSPVTATAIGVRPRVAVVFAPEERGQRSLEVLSALADPVTEHLERLSRCR